MHTSRLAIHRRIGPVVRGSWVVGAMSVMFMGFYFRLTAAVGFSGKPLAARMAT